MTQAPHNAELHMGEVGTQLLRIAHQPGYHRDALLRARDKLGPIDALGHLLALVDALERLQQSPPAEEQLLVGDCTRCPFAHRYGYPLDAARCVHPAAPVGLCERPPGVISSKSLLWERPEIPPAAEPPAWCPLRRGRATIRLSPERLVRSANPPPCQDVSQPDG